MIHLNESGIFIIGKYYIIVGGYLSARQGDINIPYHELLAVEYIRRRSKRILFLFTIVGFLLFTIMSGMNVLFDFLEMDFVTAINRIHHFALSSGYEHIVNTVFFVAVAITGLGALLLLTLFFSNRTYIEITFIGGIVRVPCAAIRKAESKHLVSAIQTRKMEVHTNNYGVIQQ